MKISRHFTTGLLVLAAAGSLGSLYAQRQLAVAETNTTVALVQNLTAAQDGTLLNLVKGLPPETALKKLAERGYPSLAALKAKIDRLQGQRQRVAQGESDFPNTSTAHLWLIVLSCLNFFAASMGAIALLDAVRKRYAFAPTEEQA
jgi:hypothetical protein